MDLALILDTLLPSVEYGGVPGATEATYNRLRWEDARPKPSWEEVEAAWLPGLRGQKLAEIRTERDRLLREVADPRWIRAMQEGDVAAIAQAVDHARALRDIPNRLSEEKILERISDTGSLAAYQPDWPA